MYNITLCRIFFFTLFINISFSTITYHYEEFLNNDTKPLGDRPPEYINVINHAKVNVKIPFHQYLDKYPNFKINPLVIAISISYSIYDVSAFILSLRKYYNGSVLLFVNENDDSLFYDCLRKAKIDYINITRIYPYYSNKYNDKYPIDESYLQIFPRWIYTYSIGTYRLYFIRVWLEIYGNKYSHIFVGDIRDALFQGNPFKWNIEKEGLYLTENIRGYSLKDNRWNSNQLLMYKDGYRFLDNPIICGGAIYGSYKEIKWWYEIVTDFMLKKYINVAEQLTLNYVLYSLSQEEINNHNVYILANEYGPTRHLATDVMVDVERSKPKDDNYIHNRDKTIPYFVHQYDRKKKLFIEFIKYHSKVKHYPYGDDVWYTINNEILELYNNLSI